MKLCLIFARLLLLLLCARAPIGLSYARCGRRRYAAAKAEEEKDDDNILLLYLDI
jgi:hypothetical protein